jgi:hypothetical protein
MVGEQHRLGLLHVRVAGDGGVLELDCPIEQDPLHRCHVARDIDERTLRVQPEIGGDLIIAAAARVQPGPG